MTNTPYFSVVTPSWNQGRYLSACIESVLAQGMPDFEHWVMDNCSTDETEAVLARYPHVQAVRRPDRGQSEALNRGFALARGEVICWLNSDDWYLPGAWSAVRAALADPSVDVVYGHTRVHDERQGSEWTSRAVFGNRMGILTWENVKLHQPAVFFRRRLLEDVGNLREDLHYVMDMEFFWRSSERHRWLMLDRELAVQRYHADAKTIARGSEFLAERKRVFAPLLRAHAQGNWRALWWRRQRAIARRYVALAGRDPGRGLRHLARAFLEYPLVVGQGAFWRALGSHNALRRPEFPS